MKYSRRHLNAVAQTVNNYEQSIADLVAGESEKRVLERWSEFGNRRYCLFCTSVSRWCPGCVLGFQDRRPSNCCFGCLYGDLSGSYVSMAKARRRKLPLLPALRVRLAAILSRLDSLGLEMVADKGKKS